MVRGWMKWVVVAVVVGICVPVMALAMRAKEGKKAGKETKVSLVKKSGAKAAVKKVEKNMTPRPASVRLGKNEVVKNARVKAKSSVGGQKKAKVAKQAGKKIVASKKASDMN